MWKNNEYPENSDTYLELIKERYKDMEPEKKVVLKWRIDTRLAAVKKLEHHFRLQSAISKREKQLAEDFPSDLLRIWTDFITPVTVGEEFMARRPQSSRIIWHLVLFMV